MSKGNVEDAYPLSPLQEGLLFHSLYSLDAGVYVTQYTCTLGNLNLEGFKRAWIQVQGRHAILRTAFVWKNLSKPHQVVGRRVDLPWEQQDWRALTTSEQEEKFEAYLDADRRRGFKLTRAPLLRLAVFEVANNTFKFVFSHHHLVIDGWSMPVVFKEVMTLYQGICRGEELTLEPTRPFRDYIEWLQRQDLDEAEKYWRQALKGFTTPTALGPDRAPGKLRGGEDDYASQQFQISLETTLALQSLARQHHLTINTLLQGAWALLLYHYTGERDVVFGSTMSGRPPQLAGVESTVGMFINTLPLRAQISPDVPFLDWLELLQQQQTELQQYDYSSLTQVQAWSEVPRGVPLFESLLVFQNYPVDASLRQPGGSLQVSDVRSIAKGYDPLVLAPWLGPELWLMLIYDRRRFSEATIGRMFGHLRTLFEGMQHRVSFPTILSEEEKRQVLIEWNLTDRDFASEACIPELFEAQVRNSPEAVAVVFDHEQLSYGELNRRANQLAHYLRELGIGPEARVGIYLRRSAEMIVAMLGVLKAGGAYVPLDPAYPRQRLAFMVVNSGLKILLSESKMKLGFSNIGVKVVRLDKAAEKLSLQSEENPSGGESAQNLAYVIYTSGSTGEPKGVEVSHVGVVNLAAAQIEKFGVKRESRVLQFASMSFDASVSEVMMALLAGARLVMARQERLMPGMELTRLMEEEGITTVTLPPSVLRVMKDEVREELETIISAGEALSEEEAKRWSKGRRLINAYGPSEVTVCASMGEYGADGERVTIGEAMSNTRVYVLDRQMNAVAIGVAGEMYITGVGLARGYGERADLTAERFLPEPYSGRAGERMYRSGDLGRRGSGGELEFIGRADEQVKVRGYRIELGEIETVLRRHRSVREAVVVMREEGAGDKRLVAYVVSEEGQEVRTDELREHLKERLPEYMVPAAYVKLAEMPLSPNGKIDRRSLPEVSRERDEQEVAFEGARSVVEEILTGIWQEVLGIDRIGIHDNFFKLGGQSLLTTQVGSRLLETFQVELPLLKLFDAPTIASLAVVVEEAMRANQGLKVPSIERATRNGELPLSFAQQRMWFLEHTKTSGSDFTISTLARMTGRLDINALQRSFAHIVERHEILRTTFATTTQGPVQVISSRLDFAIPLVDLRDLSDTDRALETRRLTDEEVGRSFDLSTGPLLRATLLRLADDSYVALFTMHHIVSDGWSVGVLIREIGALYETFCNRTSPALRELPIQYADYTIWQRRWLQGEVLEAELSYWRRQLAGAPSELRLLTNRPRPEVQNYAGAIQSIALSEALTDSIKALSRKENATLFMTLLAAFDALLYRYTGQEDIVIGTPIANRDRIETEALIGFFVNTLVLRTDLSSNPGFRQLLVRVRQTALDAYAHQHLPFETLVADLLSARNLGQNPLFQVMFVLQNTPAPALELQGVTINFVEGYSRSAHVDLSMEAVDTAQGLVVQLTYRAEMFDRATIDEMLAHYKTLLEAAVSNPEVRLLDIPLNGTEQSFAGAASVAARAIGTDASEVFNF